MDFPYPLSTAQPAVTFSRCRLRPCGKTAVTPVRRSPEVRDACPTRTPATSVMAACGPTGNCPRARKSRGRGIAPHTEIGRILLASCWPLRGGGRIQDDSSALGHPHTSSWARLATGACGNATRAELKGRRMSTQPSTHQPRQRWLLRSSLLLKHTALVCVPTIVPG